MGLFCLLVAIVFSFLHPQNVGARIVLKCPNFVHKTESSESSKIDSDHITIPAFLMSNFESATFRLESNISYLCDLNYEVIKISLIGSETVNINLNSGTTPDSAVDLVSYTEEIERNDNSNGTRNVYGSFPFPQSRNSSYVKDFLYSVENITGILDSTSTAIPEEAQPGCDRKLNRNSVHFTPTGVMFYSDEYYRPIEYCIESFNEVAQEITVRKCNVDCNNKMTPCIPLCCHLHEYIDLQAWCCQATLGSEPMFQPVIYDGINRRLSLEETIEPGGISEAFYSNGGKAVNDEVLRPHYVRFKFDHVCPDGVSHLYFNEHGESSANSRIHIRNSGKVAYINYEKQWNFMEKFCVAGISNADGFEGLSNMTSMLYYCDNSENENVLSAREKILWISYLFIGVFAFSSVFLFLTVIVYILLWERQNIHGWTIISFVTSEFFLFVFLSVSHGVGLFMYADDGDKSILCKGTGMLAHFFFLATFSWLTIINLDLWWTFKSLTPLSERSKGRKRFCLYMTFAWGLPVTVISVGLALQFVYKNTMTDVLLPDYGHQGCFIARQAKGVYLYYIVGVLLLINFITISLTFLTIYKFKKSTRMASSSSSKSKEQSFKLFIKLVIVMGVTWTFEFIMWLDDDGENISWIVLVLDVMNALQAVATFVIFVCKRKILNQLEQKHPALKVITRPLMIAMGSKSNTFMSSISSRQTRSTTGVSSVIRGSRNKSLKLRDSVKMDTATTATAAPAIVDSKV